MSKSIKSKQIRLFLLPAIILLISGCNPFAPGLSDDQGAASSILTDQKTPQEVLTNFAFAYNFKDSLVYSDLIDSTFLFLSNDFSTNPVTPIRWGRDTELKTTTGLFRHFQTLNLNWGGTIYEFYTDLDSSEVQLGQVFQLTLNEGVQITTLNGEAEFTLKKNDSGIWKIVLWIDKKAN